MLVTNKSVSGLEVLRYHLYCFTYKVQSWPAIPQTSKHDNQDLTITLMFGRNVGKNRHEDNYLPSQVIRYRDISEENHSEEVSY